MSNITYTSIDSVLFRLASIIPNDDFEESKFREWATEGFLQTEIRSKYENKNILLTVDSHKSFLPQDLRYLTQIFYKESLTEEENQDLIDQVNIQIGNDTDLMSDDLAKSILENYTPNTNNGWAPMSLSSSSFIKTVTSGASPYVKYDCCDHEYTVDPSKCLTTTLKDGFIWVSYLAYVKDENGSILIPDNEVLKSALEHYCIYRYWLARSLTSESASYRERDWNLNRYAFKAKRAAGQINLPSTQQLDNLIKQTNRLHTSNYESRNHYSGLNKREFL
jgi:hypothetical protein